MEETEFCQRLLETAQWCHPRADITNSKGCFRSLELQPDQSLFQAFRRPRESDSTTALQMQIVEQVCMLRHSRVFPIHAADTSIESGRLLLLDVSSTMYDELAMGLTHGFYDESDAPPWDTWVAYLTTEHPSRPDDERTTLISWIPNSFIPLAQIGIDVVPGECLKWSSCALIAPSSADKSQFLDEIRRELFPF